MDAFTTFQKLITLSVAVPQAPAAQVNEVIQSRVGYLDVADVPSVAIHAEIFDMVTGGELLLETAVSEEGPWGPVESWQPSDGPSTGNPIDETIEMTTFYSAQYPLARFVRWRFTQTGQGGEVCFRLSYQVKSAA